MRVYLRTKFQVSGIILTRFRMSFTTSFLQLINEPLKSPTRLSLSKSIVHGLRSALAPVGTLELRDSLKVAFLRLAHSSLI